MRNLEAVLFDVDFTLVRPGPELGPEGYRRLGGRHGLVLEPERYETARAVAIETLKRHPELRHDDEIWIAFTEVIVREMGGDAVGARECAEEMTAAWELHHNFELYEDALPVLEELRGCGLKLGLVSNTGRDLQEFVHGANRVLDFPVSLRDLDDYIRDVLVEMLEDLVDEFRVELALELGQILQHLLNHLVELRMLGQP